MENISSPWGEKNTNDGNVTKYHDEHQNYKHNRVKREKNTMLGQDKQTKYNKTYVKTFSFV